MPTVRSFSGHKVHKIDAKNRLSIPADMRHDLGEEFYITLGIDSCLCIYTFEGWDEFMETINNFPESLRKKAQFKFVANAEMTSLDPNGRVALSENLRKKGFLLDEKEAVVYGASDRIEIWKKSFFDERMDEGEEVDWSAAFDTYGGKNGIRS